MSLTVVNPPNLTVGDPYSPVFSLMVNDVAVPSNTVIKAAVVDYLKTKVYLPPVTCTYDGISKWTATFSTTTAFLSEPTNLASKLDSTLMKTKDIDPATGKETGYAIALLEIQIGAPYSLTTRHAEITVGKGLIS